MRGAIRTPRRRAQPKGSAAGSFDDLRRRGHRLGDGGNDARAEASGLQATSHFCHLQRQLRHRQLERASCPGALDQPGSARSGAYRACGVRCSACNAPRRTRESAFRCERARSIGNGPFSCAWGQAVRARRHSSASLAARWARVARRLAAARTATTASASQVVVRSAASSMPGLSARRDSGRPTAACAGRMSHRRSTPAGMPNHKVVVPHGPPPPRR